MKHVVPYTSHFEQKKLTGLARGVSTLLVQGSFRDSLDVWTIFNKLQNWYCGASLQQIRQYYTIIIVILMIIIIIGVVVIWRYFVLDRRPVTSSKRVALLCLTLFYVISITIMSPSSSSSSSSWGACKLAQRQIHHHQFFVIIAIIVIVMCIYLNLFLSSLWASQLAHHKWKHIQVFGLSFTKRVQ